MHVVPSQIVQVVKCGDFFFCLQALIPVRFGADNIQKFQEGIENLYNSIQSPIPAPEFAQKLKNFKHILWITIVL